MYPTTVANETGQRRPRSREITALSFPSPNVSLSRRPLLRCGRQTPELQSRRRGWSLEGKSRQQSSLGAKATAPRQAGDKRVISLDQVSTPLSPGKLNHPLLLAPPLDSYRDKNRDKERRAASLGSSSPTPEAQAGSLAVAGLKPALKRKLEPH